MKLYIKQPVALHETGNQELNEDFVYPLISQVNPEERLFIVCDGEGGANAGEVASKLVALNLAKYYASNPPKGEIDQAFLDNALIFVERKLSSYKSEHPESLQMATSIALLCLGPKQVTMAWVGNCEVAYFNAATQKLVNTHDTHTPSTEKITGIEQPAKIHMRFLPNEDIGIGDYFFLSTTGLKEHVDESTLTTLFESGSNPKNGPSRLLEEIRILNQGFARDNYSCYLIQVEKVGDGATVVTNPVAKGAVAQAVDDNPTHDAGNNGLARTLTFAAIVAILACLVGLAAYWSRSQDGFDKLMSRGGDAMMSDDYALAVSRFDSALLVASTPEERNLALNAKEDAADRFAEGQKPNLDEPIESLTESAQVYLEQAEAFFKEGKYIESAQNYRRAERVKERQQLTEPLIPFDRMAHAFLMAGNEIYETEPGDCALAEAYYEKAFYLLESPETKPLSAEAYASGMQYRDSCANGKDIRVITSAEKPDDKPASAQDATASSTNTRSVAPRTSSPAATPPAEKKEEPAPVPIAEAARKSSPDKQSSPVSPSGINTRGMDAELESSLKKYISEGERLYVRAKAENSNYLYKLSADNLLRAEAILDGPSAYMLAYMYHMGLGVDKDASKALQYAQRSALKNWPAGHYLYAHMLLERQNPRDTLTARASLERAAALNYPDAIFRLQELN